MKRSALVRHLRLNGCQLLREGRSHTIWVNAVNGCRQTVPRHAEIKNELARRICRQLGIPQIGKD